MQPHDLSVACIPSQHPYLLISSHITPKSFAVGSWKAFTDNWIPGELALKNLSKMSTCWRRTSWLFKFLPSWSFPAKLPASEGRMTELIRCADPLGCRDMFFCTDFLWCCSFACLVTEMNAKYRLERICQHVLCISKKLSSTSHAMNTLLKLLSLTHVSLNWRLLKICVIQCFNCLVHYVCENWICVTVQRLYRKSISAAWTLTNVGSDSTNEEITQKSS